jgi:hypothetical protein
MTCCPDLSLLRASSASFYSDIFVEVHSDQLVMVSAIVTEAFSMPCATVFGGADSFATTRGGGT